MFAACPISNVILYPIQVYFFLLNWFSVHHCKISSRPSKLFCKNCWCLIEENSELVKASFMQLLSLFVMTSEDHFPGFEKCSKLILVLLLLYLSLFYNYVAAMQVPPNKPKAINLFWMTFWTECKNQVLRQMIIIG